MRVWENEFQQKQAAAAEQIYESISLWKRANAAAAKRGGVPVYGSVEWKRSSPGFNINSSSSRGKSMEAAAEDLLCLSVMGVVGDAGWGVMQRNRWKFN